MTLIPGEKKEEDITEPDTEPEDVTEPEQEVTAGENPDETGDEGSVG